MFLFENRFKMIGSVKMGDIMFLVEILYVTQH